MLQNVVGNGGVRAITQKEASNDEVGGDDEVGGERSFQGR